jgi:LysR family transcriptional regulator, glycine cleavage system transcriptional activator
VGNGQPEPLDWIGPGRPKSETPDDVTGAKATDVSRVRRLKRLPPLNLFRVFDAAARHGSFTLAGDELCVTPSAVSQQIRQLEEFLEFRLFRRLPRRVELTREGTALAGVVQESLVMLTGICEKLGDPTGPTVICVNAAPAVASKWLVPRLKRFMDAYPSIKVTLIASNDPVDFDRQDIDIALRWGNPESWTGVQVDPLGPRTLFPVISPTLLDGSRPLTSADAFEDLTLLQVVNGTPWSAWAEQVGLPGIRFADTLYFGEPDHMLEAAAQGQGICLTTEILARSEIDRARLVQAHPRSVTIDEGFHILTSQIYGAKPALAQFRQWLQEEVGDAGAVSAR